MGLIREYADRAVQTDTRTVPSPYADPAVVLAAPSVLRRAHAQAHAELSPPRSDGACVVPNSPVSPILAPLVSRRLPKRKPARHLAGEIGNRRIVSMPENMSETLSIPSGGHGKRVVSMPDRIRPLLEPSVDLFLSPSTAGDSFGSYGGHREHVCVFPAPSDIPQTPSPPSSPESLLIIATGTQLPEGFLRRKYSPEPLIEEEDWITWANSPPRPIPALHGPLSLPYARCPSGAEGTIIEEHDNVAQMIWGLGPDDQPHNQFRADGSSSHSDVSLHGSSQVPPRLQKKRTAVHHVPKLSRTSSHTSHSKPGLSRTQRQGHDDQRNTLSLSQVPPDIDIDTCSGLPWTEEQSTPVGMAVPDKLADDPDVFPIDDNRVLEWQLARLRHALRSSLVDMDSYNTYSGLFEPVVPATVAPGFPQPYPRIFVEPRPNESTNPGARQLPIELAQQYRQQQLYKQALQKRKSQAQNILPTPPNSSSPRWSSQFSPYLAYCSTFSPELVGSTEHLVSMPSQKFRSGVNTSQHVRRAYDRDEQDDVRDFDTSTNISSTTASRTSTASFRQSPSSSSTLAKYIKQLQALSPTAHFSPLQPVIPPKDSLSSTNDSAINSFRGTYHSPVVPTPPSPESPPTLPRGPSYNSSRSISQTRPMRRRLSSVPEEDTAVVEHSASVSSSRLPSQVTIDGSSSSHDGTMGQEGRYLEVLHADVTRKTGIPDLPEPESNSGIAFHDRSPAKVRLPGNKEHNTREQPIKKEGHQHGHRRKSRFKKLRESTTTSG